MSQYVVDTSVISVLAPTRAPLSAKEEEWAQDNQGHWLIPTVVVMELEQGVQKLVRLGSTNKSRQLSEWLERLLTAFSDRIVDLDLASARKAGIFSDMLISKGRHPGFADVTTAAIADVRGLTVLTRNLRHFEPIGVSARDPFARSA